MADALRELHSIYGCRRRVPLGAWAFTGCLLFAQIIAGPPPDAGWWTVFLAAPAAVPFFALLDPGLFTLVWLECVLLTSFVIYRVLRRRFPDQPAN